MDAGRTTVTVTEFATNDGEQAAVKGINENGFTLINTEVEIADTENGRHHQRAWPAAHRPKK